MSVVARLLLPGRLRDGTLLPWASIASRTKWSEPVDGYTPWQQLVELRSGVDPAKLPVAAAGHVYTETCAALLEAFGSQAEAEWVWMPDLPWSDVTQSTDLSDPSPRAQSGTLREIVAEWAHGRFSGRAQCDTSLIEAPPYADSLLVTTTNDVFQRMALVGLEVYEVSRAHRIPIWRD